MEDVPRDRSLPPNGFEAKRERRASRDRAPDVRVAPGVDGVVLDDGVTPIVQSDHVGEQLGTDAVTGAGDRVDP